MGVAVEAGSQFQQDKLPSLPISLVSPLEPLGPVVVLVDVDVAGAAALESH